MLSQFPNHIFFNQFYFIIKLLFMLDILYIKTLPAIFNHYHVKFEYTSGAFSIISFKYLLFKLVIFDLS